MSDTQFIRKFAGRDVDIRDIEKQFTNKDGTFKNPRGIKRKINQKINQK